MKPTETTDRLVTAYAAAKKLERSLDSRFGSGLVVTISSYGESGEREDVPPVCIRAEDADRLVLELRAALEKALMAKSQHQHMQSQQIAEALAKPPGGRMKPRDLINLLNRAAAFMETPGDLTDTDRRYLHEDLIGCAEELETE